MPAEKRSNIESLLRRFHQMFGESGASVLRAPARINILGEHVDYVSYLPTASLAFGSHEHAMTMLFRPTGNGKVRGTSMNESFAPFEFSLSETAPPALGAQRLRPAGFPGKTAWKRKERTAKSRSLEGLRTQAEKSWENFVFNRPVPAPDWSNYVKGAVSFAQWKFGKIVKNGFDFLIDSTIPAASGASSSSALVVLAGAAIRQSNQIEFERPELAHDSSQAEWFPGTRGGALDHKTICEADHGYAVIVEHADKCIHSGFERIRAEQFRWATFFTHPADKGREVMLEYNERAAVSRLVIPALLKAWKHECPRRALMWLQAVAKLRAHDLGAWDKLAMLLNYLPETITLEEVRSRFPETFQECETVFPALVRERYPNPLKLRDRALHHLGETWRVREAASVLAAINRDEYIEEGMRMVGDLINQSHVSLRDLYEVSTPQVEQLIEIVRRDSQVYGARLMGGGFGGNVLALTTADNISKLVDRVQKEFYAPQGRDLVSEGSVMISTPGDGLSGI